MPRFRPFLLSLAVLGVLVAAARPLGPHAMAETGTTTPPRIEQVAYPGDLVPVATYLMDNGAPTLVQGAHDADVDSVWALVNRVWPTRFTERVRQLALTDESPGGLVATVHRSGIEPDRWILTIDAADTADRARLLEALVHELGHVVTIDVAHVTLDPDGDRPCNGERMDGLGCALPGSPAARFVARFWDGSDDAADPERFVSSYASSSIAEDLAESFATWVLGPTPPTGTTAAAKVAFFDELPGMRSLRAELRAAIDATA